MQFTRPLFMILVLVLAALVPAAGVLAGEETPGAYSYSFQGKIVTLSPSDGFVAVKQARGATFAPAASLGLVPAQGKLASGFADKGYVLYALPAEAKGKGKSAADLAASRAATRDKLLASGEAEVQPVFEQGWATMIPCERVVVGFHDAATADDALNLIWTVKDELGVLDLAPLRKNTFVATISNPGNGRAFAVAQALAQVDGVRFAEPDMMLVWQRELTDKEPATPAAPLSLPGMSKEAVAALSAQAALEPPYRTADRGASPGWMTLATANAETAGLPGGWTAGAGAGYADAYWGRTNAKARSGSWSYYCAKNGSQGVESPGPVPTDMGAYIFFVADFSSYAEAYVEFWFYAKNEVGADGTLFDYGYLILWDSSTSASSVQYLVHNGPIGDMTTDPTAANGWRRCLFRIPPAFRKAGIAVEIDWISDSTTQTEGLYVDDIRILGSANVDTEPLGSDPFGGRQYELRNMGQVAGLGTTANDLSLVEALGLVPFSSVTVAVLDDGMDLTHPDLNLVQGYDWNGAPGGSHKSNEAAHGTACGGNVGARANTIGVRGTSPAVPIMPVEVLGSIQTDADVAAGIDVAVLHGAKVLSNSWGWIGVPVQVIVDAIRDALNAGRTVVFAAGNGPDRSPWSYEVAFPGNQTGTLDIITVGATSPTDEHKAAASSDGLFNWGSSYIGSGPDVMAPGPWSYTTDRQGALGYNDGSVLADASYDPSFGGTSSSTPKVSGICSLLYQANAELYPRAVKDILMQTADKTVNHNDDKSGAGRVNAYQAVRKAQLWHAPAWWWDKSKPGTGLSIELQGEKVYLAWYVYDATGRPVWYACLASRSGDQVFTGNVFRASGWPLGSTWDGPPVITTVGTCTLTFQGAGSATFAYNLSGLPAGSMSLTRLFDNMDGLTNHAFDPRNVSGWWWDPNLEGMGIFIEARGNTLYFAWYHYRADRSPRWWSLGGGDVIGMFPPATATFSAPLREWKNGQTAGGVYKLPTYTDQSGGTLTFNADGTLTVNSGAGTYTLQRFQFSQF